MNFNGVNEGRCIMCGRRTTYYVRFCEECAKKWL
jgi:predicted amidophosphoribosyltransferase